MGERRAHDGKQAVVLLGVVAALVGIPAALAAVIPVPETALGPDDVIEVIAAGAEPDTVTFGRVGGWEQRPTGDRSAAALEGPGETVLSVSVVDGVTDPAEAADWRRKVLGVQGFDAVFDGGEINTANGFRGPTCRRADRPGVCAIVTNDNLAVTVVLGGDAASLPELMPILESLQVRR